MFHLQWDWLVTYGICFSGAPSGFFIAPATWPARLEAHVNPPYATAMVVALTGWAAFFIPLAVFRAVAGETVELQATILSLIYLATGAVGLWLRGHLRARP